MKKRPVMVMEEFLLFALAIIYFVIPYGHSPTEGRAERHSEKHDSARLQHGAERLKRDLNAV